MLEKKKRKEKIQKTNTELGAGENYKKRGGKKKQIKRKIDI